MQYIFETAMATMFTETDVKSLLNLFPPQKTPDFIPSLTLASSGNGFVTLQFIQAQFRSRVTKDPNRISLLGLASELDIDPQLVLQLVRNHPKLALLSKDSKSIIAADERDALLEKFKSLLFDGLVLKDDFSAENDIHVKSLDILLGEEKGEVVSIEGYMCSKRFESKAFQAISDLLTQALKDVHPVDIHPGDLPSSPPIWFISHILQQLLASDDLDQKISIQDRLSSIHCTPIVLLEQKRDAKIKDLQSGDLAYLDLQDFASESSGIVSSYQDVLSHFQSLPSISVIDTFAVSQAWVAGMEEDCIRILEQEGCSLDVSEVIGSRLPTSIRSIVAARIEADVITEFSKNAAGPQILRAESFLLTTTRRDNAIEELIGYAKADAEAQWTSLSASPSSPIDPKFSASRIEGLIPEGHRVLHTFLTESLVKKTLDETFSSTLSTFETQNEEAFAEFWVDCVTLKVATYTTGLSSISDANLASQLSELLAGCAHSDLLPSTLSKAREQGLLLSRRSRKNVARLSSILESTKTMDLPTVTAALEKFSKKQGLRATNAEALASSKKVMVEDMLRDMQKRVQKQKASDGPVLFLLLVIVLFAKQFDGIVYATGKFAPKILKQLKGGLEAEQYEQVEKWKEAAKTNSLTADDKAAMVAMAEG